MFIVLPMCGKRDLELGNSLQHGIESGTVMALGLDNSSKTISRSFKHQKVKAPSTHTSSPWSLSAPEALSLERTWLSPEGIGTTLFSKQ